MSKVTAWLLYKMGYRTITRINTSPPNNLYHEVAPGQYVKPGGYIAANVILEVTMLGRLRVLLSGRIQVAYVAWTEKPPVMLGDHMAFEVNPPIWGGVKSTPVQ